jgi:cbb3-type cytochrome oxidase subunit 3
MIFEHRSKRKSLLIIIAVIVFLVGAVLFVLQKLNKEDNNQEIMGCFAEEDCFDIAEREEPGFGNDQIEKAITNYLLTQKQFSWETREGSQSFCVIENLYPEKEIFPLYIWALCEEFKIENNELKTLSGSSGPVKIDYPNEMSFYDINKFSYEVPGDGAGYYKDIKRIFPKEAQERMFNIQITNIRDLTERIEVIAFSNILNWKLIKEAINNCEVKEVFQAHSREVSVRLKNGIKLTSVEPNIDDIIDLVVAVEPKCGSIRIVIE